MSWVAVITAIALTVTPACAYASVRDADRVGGVKVAASSVPRAAMPDVGMKSGALVTSDGRFLWERRPNDRRAIASITKIMTAIVALERTKPTDKVRILPESLAVGESTSFLREGETLPMADLIEALLVKSGNDAAVAIAVHVAGGEKEFVALMNRRASELGLKGTRFTNAHGLDQEGNHSTAADLATLSRYAMTKPLFRATVRKKSARIGSGRRSERVESTNLLLGNYSGANGVKTGWTDAAGYCVIASARRDGVELQAVVLGSKGELSRFRDARDLLDFGFAHYRPQKLGSKGTVVGEAPVAEYLDVGVPAAISRDTSIAVFDLSGPITRTVSVSTVEAPVEVGDPVGVASFTQNGEVVATIPLVAASSVQDPSLFQRVGIALMRGWRALTGTG